jgi:hypothetical protein
MKGLHLAFYHRLFSPDRGDTGNELVTKLCLKRVFPCLFLSELACLNPSKNAVNQSICFDLHKSAFDITFQTKAGDGEGRIGWRQDVLSRIRLPSVRRSNLC